MRKAINTRAPAVKIRYFTHFLFLFYYPPTLPLSAFTFSFEVSPLFSLSCHLEFFILFDAIVGLSVFFPLDKNTQITP